MDLQDKVLQLQFQTQTAVELSMCTMSVLFSLSFSSLLAKVYVSQLIELQLENSQFRGCVIVSTL